MNLPTIFLLYHIINCVNFGAGKTTFSARGGIILLESDTLVPQTSSFGSSCMASIRHLPFVVVGVVSQLNVTTGRFLHVSLFLAMRKHPDSEDGTSSQGIFAYFADFEHVARMNHSTFFELLLHCAWCHQEVAVVEIFHTCTAANPF